LVLWEKVTTANTGWFSGQLFNTYIYNHGFPKIKELVSNISKSKNWFLMYDHGSKKIPITDPYFLQTERPTLEVFRNPQVHLFYSFWIIFNLSKCEHTQIVHAPAIRLGMLSLILFQNILYHYPTLLMMYILDIKLKMFKILNLSLFLSWHPLYDESPNSMMCIQLSQFLHQGHFGFSKNFLSP
jgi:hypothetical protein